MMNYQGKACGISQGISEGKNNEKNMLDKNVDIDLISKFIHWKNKYFKIEIF